MLVSAGTGCWITPEKFPYVSLPILLNWNKGSLAQLDVPGEGNVWSLLPAFRGRRQNVGVTAN